MIKQLLAAAAIFAMTAVTQARAEGGCPPGSIPQNGQGVHACIPIPTNNPQGAPSAGSPGDVWVEGWQAIATDNDKGIIGTSKDMLTTGAAEGAALEDCQAKGGTDCRIQMSYGNGCVAMAVGAAEAQFYNGPSQKKAESKAMKACESRDSSCRIYYSACSFPKQVR